MRVSEADVTFGPVGSFGRSRVVAVNSCENDIENYALDFAMFSFLTFRGDI